MITRFCIVSLVVASWMALVTGCQRQDSSAELKAELESAKKELRENAAKEQEALLLELKKQQALINALTRKLTEQETNSGLAAISEKLDKLEAELEKLENEQFGIKFRQNLAKAVALRPGSQGYDYIDTDLGALTFSLDDISPYGYTTKVMLKIGNTVSATLNDVRVDIEYGPTDDRGAIIVDKKKTKKDVSLGRLKGGSFTKVAVVLEGIKPEEFGLLFMGNVQIGGIALQAENPSN